MIKQISLFAAAMAVGLTLSGVTQAAEPESTKVAREGSEAAKAGDWDKAIDAFRKAAGMDHKWTPSLSAALQQRAVKRRGEQNFQGAEADLTEALKISPKDAGIHERRAYVEMKLNNNDAALADYSEAIKINPREVRFYLFRSYIYEVKGDTKNSMADTDHVLSIDKDNAEAKARKERLQKIEMLKANAPGATPIPAPSAQPKKK
jgi:tetratricopeptide (TPR) repeat protein